MITITKLNLLLANVTKLGSCLIYRGSKYRNGYGRIKEDGKTYLIHRLVLCFAFDKDYDDSSWKALHKQECESRGCINLEHLYVGTTSDNNRDTGQMKHGNAGKTHCPKGHEYSLENTMIRIRGGNKLRECKTCHRERNRDD